MSKTASGVSESQVILDDKPDITFWHCLDKDVYTISFSQSFRRPQAGFLRGATKEQSNCTNGIQEWKSHN